MDDGWVDGISLYNIDEKVNFGVQIQKTDIQAVGVILVRRR